MPMQRAASQLQQCYASGSEMSALQTRFWTSAKRGVLVECNVHPLRMDA